MDGWICMKGTANAISRRRSKHFLKYYYYCCCAEGVAVAAVGSLTRCSHNNRNNNKTQDNARLFTKESFCQRTICSCRTSTSLEDCWEEMKKKKNSRHK